MRVPLGVIALVGMLLMPYAAADARPPPPKDITQVDVDTLFVALGWTPVVDVDAYVVYRGPTDETLVPIATTSGLAYFDDEPVLGDLYGVASVRDHVVGDVHLVAPGHRGDCVSAGTNLHVTITFANCFKS